METPLILMKSNDSDDISDTHTQSEHYDENSRDGNGLSSSLLERSRRYSRWSPIDEGITLAWEDLTVSVKDKKNYRHGHKRIVNGVSGAIKSGSLVALMGTSGAGKSTFMSALANRLPGTMEADGKILVNGRQIGDYMKYVSGYMHQDDLFIGSLTVLEHMQIMARLKLDRRTTAHDRNKKIEELLRNLGLMKCLHTQIGTAGTGKSLSGGEKKRLSFATELLTDPPILFCDEPTTGLDSYSARKIVKMMNVMAAKGMTILCTIHQPSSEIFTMFSQVLLLAEGRIAYMGSIANAIDFFDALGYTSPTSYNPAEFFIKTLATPPGQFDNKKAVKCICDNFAVSDYAKEIDVVLQYEIHKEKFVQTESIRIRQNYEELNSGLKMFWLMYRSFLEIIRNPAVQGLRILQKIGIAILVGACYLGTNANTQAGIQSVQGAIFMIVTENTFNPMYSVLAEFQETTPLFLREYNSGLYHPLLYYIARIIAMLPGLILEPVIYVIICYWLANLRATAYAFFMTTLAATLTMNVATACGVFFSNAFDSAQSGMAYLVPFDYILMVTSGLFIKLSSLPQLLSWTQYLSWIMYSTESLSILQWQGVTNITCEITDSDIPCIKEGSQVLEKFSFSEENLTRDLWNMLFLCIGFYCLGYFCLWLKIKRK